MELNKLFLAMMAVSSITLTACGGDSGSSKSADADQADAQVLTGTAATGLAMDGTVFVYDAEGRSTNVVINDDGSFSVNVDGMTPPFMLEARPDDASLAIQYSFAEAADINVNVTPLTTLALFIANDEQSLSALVTAWDDQAESFDEAALAEAEETIRANFADQFEEQSIDPETYDLFNAVFRADHTGFDAVLDDVKIVFDMDGGSFDVEVDDADYAFVPDADFDDETGGETDTTPDAISFASQTDVNPDEDAFSEVVTVTGFDGAATVTITNGQFQVNNGNWVTTGTISAGDSLRLFQEVPNTFETTTITTVSINGHDFSFTTTTRAADVTPDNIRFTAQTDVEPSSTVTSNTVTLAGFEGQLVLSVTNGSLLVNGAAAGTSATVSANDQIQVVQTSSGDFGTSVTSSVTLGGVSADFTSTTRAMDTTPDSFSFVSQSDVEIMAASYSNTVTLAGFDGELPISVTENAGLIINGAPPGVTSANVSAGDTIQVVQEVVGDFGSDMVTTVTLGSYSTTFTSTIRDADTSPNAFNLTNLTDAEPDTRIESNTVTLEGFEGLLTLTVTNGELRVNGDLSGASISVEAGDEVSVVQQSSADFEKTVVSTVSLGDFSTTFETTTRAADTTPDNLSFTAQADVEPSSTVTSNTVTLAGFEGQLALSVTNGSLLVNGSDAGASASVSAGDQIQVVQTSSSDFEASVTSSVTLGSVSAHFTSTTRVADAIPDEFSLTLVDDALDLEAVAPGTVVVASTVITGIEVPVGINVSSNGEFKVNDGDWISGTLNGKGDIGVIPSPATVENGDEVLVRHTAASEDGDGVTTFVAVGSGEDIEADRLDSITRIIAARSQILVTLSADSTGAELYSVQDVFDGQSSGFGHYRLGDLNAGTGNAHPYRLFPVEDSNAYFFTVHNDGSGTLDNLYYYGGDVADEPATLLHKVADHGSVASGTQAQVIATLGETAVYMGRDSSARRGLYAVGPDGNEVELLDNQVNWDLGGYQELDGSLYFIARPNTSGDTAYTVYRTDGTASGTEDIYTSINGLSLNYLAVHNGFLYLREVGAGMSAGMRVLTAMELSTNQVTEIETYAPVTEGFIQIGDQLLIGRGQFLYRPDPTDGTQLQSLGYYQTSKLATNNDTLMFMQGGDLYIRGTAIGSYTGSKIHKVASIDTDTPVNAVRISLTDGVTSNIDLSEVLGTVAGNVILKASDNRLYSFNGSTTLMPLKDANNVQLFGVDQSIVDQYSAGAKRLRTSPELVTSPEYGLIFAAMAEGSTEPTLYISTDGGSAEVMNAELTTPTDGSLY